MDKNETNYSFDRVAIRYLESSVPQVVPAKLAASGRWEKLCTPVYIMKLMMRSVHRQRLALAFAAAASIFRAAI